MDQDIEELISKCQLCQESRASPLSAILHPWQWPTHPWSCVHLDFAEPYMGHTCLVIIEKSYRTTIRNRAQVRCHVEVRKIMREKSNQESHSPMLLGSELSETVEATENETTKNLVLVTQESRRHLNRMLHYVAPTIFKTLQRYGH